MDLKVTRPSTSSKPLIRVLLQSYCPLFDFSYNLLYLVLTYVVPLCVMALCYIQMGTRLWTTSTPGEENTSTVRSKNAKQKVDLWFFSSLCMKNVKILLVFVQTNHCISITWSYSLLTLIGRLFIEINLINIEVSAEIIFSPDVLCLFIFPFSCNSSSISRNVCLSVQNEFCRNAMLLLVYLWYYYCCTLDY